MGSAVAFAKFSVERYPKAAAAVGVKGFSTVLLFVNDTEPIMACAPGYETKGAVLDHFGAGGDWRWGAECSSWTWQDIVVSVCFLSIVRYQCARTIIFPAFTMKQQQRTTQEGDAK
ncbi:uncharacterized protein [Miscanthus floridulus]|uniref:uncharacterized protein n=1 Tax=Miscanthus floridulus TaxID=154761 RepID=UPI003459769F